MIKRLKSRLGYKRSRDSAPGLGGCQRGPHGRRLRPSRGSEVVGDGGLEPPTSPIHRGGLTRPLADQGLQIHTAFHRLQLMLSPARRCLVFELFRIHERPWPRVSGSPNFTAIVLLQPTSWVSREASIVAAVALAPQNVDRIAHCSCKWWAMGDSNLRPQRCQRCALTS